MARLPLIDEHADPDIAALVGKIRGARGGRLHDFYKALLHSPGVASAWFDFNNAVRFQAQLDDRLRELVIMRVAALTGCGQVNIKAKTMEGLGDIGEGRAIAAMAVVAVDRR